MNHKNITLSTALLFLVLLIFSCAAKKEPVVIEDHDSGAILQKIALYEGAIKSLKGLAKVRINTPDGKISYTQVTIAEKPDLLRLEALNPFGKTVGFISSDGESIYIISSSEKVVYDAGMEFNLAYIYPGLNLTITANNLVNLILGRLPDNTYDMNLSPELSAESGLIKLIFASKNSSSPDYLWVNSQKLRVEQAEFSLNSGERAKIKYGYFDDLVDGLFFPKTIDFTSKGLSISIVYEEDIELNRNVDKKLFKPSQQSAKFVK